jgi:predicted phage terminase large subunit-like protein
MLPRPHPQSDEYLAMANLALREIRKATRPAAKQLPTWTPQAGPQAAFYNSSTDEILYGGAKGGGKSDSAVALSIPYINHRDFRGLVLRRETPQLNDLIDKARRIYKTGVDNPRVKYRPAAPEARIVSSPSHKVTFPSGAILYFDHCEAPSDWEKYQGQEFHLVVFDELVHFTERQYIEIKSLLRAVAPGLPRKIRATTNPGSAGHQWVFKRWKYWLDPESVIPGRAPRFDQVTGKKLPPAAPGEVLYFFTPTDGDEEIVPADTPEAQSRTFIPAKLDDNKILVEADPGYRQKIRDFDPVRRKQLEDGDWLVKPAAGLFFKRAMFDVVDILPAGRDIRWVRAWDLASTPKTDNNDPDWTRGLLVGKTPDGVLWVAHLASLRGAPGEVEKLLQTTATQDGQTVIVRLPIDPGAAGKTVAFNYTRLLMGYPVSCKRLNGDKITRATIPQGQAQVRNVRVKRGHWNDEFFDELEAFDGMGRVHDDIVDALSDAVDELGVGVPVQVIDPSKVLKLPGLRFGGQGRGF